MRKFFTSLSFVTLLIATGCAGIGVIDSSDPAVKLRQAASLYDQKDRPLPAERLIREAIDIYQKEGNQLGLAEAYTEYGFFFRSHSLEGKWGTYYYEHGFLDKTVTYGTRYQASIDYFKQARAIFLANQQFDAVTNVDLNMGFTYMLMGDKRSGCNAFDQSFDSMREAMRRDPSFHPILPKGYASYEEYILVVKEQYGC